MAPPANTYPPEITGWMTRTNGGSNGNVSYRIKTAFVTGSGKSRRKLQMIKQQKLA